jgi:D-sedoheptulose 7-phosphate isomerase
LTTDSSFLTAYSNDYGFEGIFARQVEAHGAPGDVLIAISTSGNSRNVVLAVEKARDLGIHTVGLLGTGGKLQELADIVVAVPSTNTAHIQECHITLGHILCDLVERILFEGKEE